MLKRNAGRLILSVLLMGATAVAQNTDRQFVIRRVRIFDGSQVIPEGDVWVKNGLIEATGPNLNVPPGTPEMDGGGRTLLPGLIDAHVHTMGMDRFLKSALALGVTTELDMGSSPSYADRIEREQAQGKHPEMADLRSSRTQPTAPDGHGTEYGIDIPTISSPAEAQPLVDSLIAQGADFIGEIVYDDGSEFGVRIPTLSKDALRAVIEAAHRRGKLAVVHVLSLQAAKDAVEAGADGLVHLFADQPADEEFYSLVARRHTFVIPTLSVLAAITGVSAGPSLARDPRLEPYLSLEALADLGQDYPRHAGAIGNAQQAVRRLNSEGVPILAGTDGHNPGTAHGASLLGELTLLVNSGLTPRQALASATSINATAFQLNDRGRIAPGLRADLVLVDGDPTTRISEIGNIAAVWKSGVPVAREAYRAELDWEKRAEQTRALPSSPPGSEAGLVSDFENGTAASAFGLGWVPSSGRLLGGHKPEIRISVVDGGAEGSAKALQITGEIAPGVYGWAGAMFFPGAASMAPANLSDHRAISFWTKGDGRPYQVMLYAKSKGALPVVKGFIAGPEWKRVTIPLSDFGTDGHDIQGLMIAELAAPGPFRFLIDDVRLDPAVAASQAGSAAGLADFTAGDGDESASLWRITLTSYMWLQGLHGDAQALGHNLGFKAGPADLLAHAGFGYQGLVVAQYKRLIVAADSLWMPVSYTSSKPPILPLPAGVSATVKYTPLVFTQEAGYRVIDSRRIQIDGFAGARTWRLGATLTLTPSPDGGSVYKSTNWVDPLVGSRIQVPLSSRLTATVWGDAGGWGAGSQMDYQLAGVLSYRLKPRVSVDGGWRYLYTDYQTGSFHSRTAQSGALFGVTYRLK